MSNQPKSNSNPKSSNANADTLRGRYATHTDKSKDAGKKPAAPKGSNAAARQGSSTPAPSKPRTTSARPAVRRGPGASAAAASAADSFARREKAREERARGQRGESSRGTSRSSSRGASAERAERTERSTRAAKNSKTSKAPKAPKAPKRPEKIEAEYTPYGFEPSARVGLLLRRIPYVLGAAAVIAVIVLASNVIGGFMPIDVTVNGKDVKVGGDRSVATAFEEAGQPAKAGDLYDVEGELLEKGGGELFTAAVNGKAVKDPDTKLEKGDAVVFSQGEDKEEPLKHREEIVIQPKSLHEGNGPLHVITQEGTEGLKVKKTGEISGKTVTEVEKKAEPRIYQNYSPNVGNDKVIALTFDDGPWEGSTDDILNILAANEAKATFFTIGERITPETEDLIKRMANEGHQICTHTWDHASGSGQGVNLSYMSKSEQREEVEKGMKAISDVTGAEASSVFRAPGGNFPAKVWKNVEDLVSAEIGWNIDTVDWQKPGSDYIAEQIMSATSGCVVLMHDGGGDRSQTVEALRSALPYLKEQGYRFITIDELLEYPPAE